MNKCVLRTSDAAQALELSMAELDRSYHGLRELGFPNRIQDGQGWTVLEILHWMVEQQERNLLICRPFFWSFGELSQRSFTCSRA